MNFKQSGPGVCTPNLEAGSVREERTRLDEVKGETRRRRGVSRKTQQSEGGKQQVTRHTPVRMMSETGKSGDYSRVLVSTSGFFL